MSFFKTILVPTDFTQRSEVAYRHACEIAAKTGDTVCLLNVVEPPYEFPSRLNEIIESRKTIALEELESVKNGLKSVEKFSHIDIEVRIETGKIISTILHQINKKMPGLVIMGTGGEYSLKNLIYGSITNSMLLNSPVPVLGIPANTDYRSVNSFIFATDLRKHDLKIIKWVQNLASAIGSEFHAIHIDTNDHEKSTSEFESRLKNEVSEKSVLEVRKGEDFFSGMTSYLVNTQGQIIVMPRYKKKFIEWLTSKSSAREIAHYGRSPLLIIPAE
jgi:nucleotide-binding universal stress UspA family protein